MRMNLFRLAVVLGAALVFHTQGLAAQTGTVAGQVLDAETGAPVSAAQIQVLGAGEAQEGGVLSDTQGRFRLQLRPGTYALVATSVGYTQERVDGVTVLAGQTTQVTVRMTSAATVLNPIVVTGRRREEKALESPSSVVTIGAERIQERAALTPVEHVKALPGVDVVQSGLTSSNVVTRGFNNVFSGSMLVLTDNRYAFVPSLRFNAYNMIPTTQFDVDRVEVLLGPAAALYGPNAANGVMHLLTTSPIDDPGSKVSLAGGERSVFHGQARTAYRISDKLGIKLSGQYFTGNDWTFVDPFEQAQLAQLTPEERANTLIARRDFDTERYSGELRVDWRPDDETEVIFSAGSNVVGSSIELTGIGAGQADDWAYNYFQTRFRKGRLFAQAFINQSDAGDTYLLRTGEPIVDRSRMIATQIQHGFSLGERQDFVYGVDLQRSEPRTGGTITGRNEDDDTIDEIGGYLHSETELSESLKLVAALRVDGHNRLEDPVFSPRAALVFTPRENQTFRVTYNRAFSTPTTNNLFLDLLAGQIPLGPGLGYDIRTLGVPETGFTFNETCAGGVQNYCMYSPFTAGQLPANAALLWDGLVQTLLGGDPATAALIPLLLGPGAGEIGSVLRRFNQEELTFLPDEGGPEPISRMLPTIYNNFEVGYKGILGGKLLVSADLYTQQIRDFVGPLRTETPSVFLDPTTVQAFVQDRLAPLITGGQVTPQQVGEIVAGLAQVPVGTVAPDQVDSSDLILTYRNFGEVNLWGADLSFQYLATDRLSFTGTYSHVSDECFLNETASCSSALAVALNAPQNKGSLGVRWEDEVRGLTLDSRARFQEGFPMNSGVFIGDVEGYTAIDANVSYQLPFAPDATVGLTASNLLLFSDSIDGRLTRRVQQFVGAPAIGRLIMARIQYTF